MELSTTKNERFVVKHSVLKFFFFPAQKEIHSQFYFLKPPQPFQN